MAPFCTSTFTSTFFKAFLGAHTTEKKSNNKKENLFLLYTICANASNNTPSYTHVSSTTPRTLHAHEMRIYFNALKTKCDTIHMKRIGVDRNENRNVLTFHVKRALEKVQKPPKSKHGVHFILKKKAFD